GSTPDRVTPREAPAVARALLALGPGSVVLKLGAQGCFYSDGSREVRAPSFPVKAVDTTAAGDTFNAALAIALAEDRPIESALRFANAAAAISVTRIGAQASVPSRAEVEALLDSSSV
ncbi:MAG: PfkB family carbohydrate kinase, partial [Bryobacteraceae bacterium]